MSLILINISRLFLILLFIILQGNCTLHYLKIDDQVIALKNNPKLPDRINLNLERIQVNDEKPDHERILKESYNSENLNKILEKGCCIDISNNQNYTLAYSTSLSHNIPLGVTPIFFLLTLGISPVYETIDSSIKFKIIEKKNQKVLKEYHYRGSHKFMTSWLSLIAAVFLWGDEWDLAMFNNHDFPQEIIANKFEIDLLADINSQKIQFKENFIPNKIELKSGYAILPVKYSHSKDKNISEVIRDKIETLLVNKNYNVLERNRMSEITKEMKFSQLGLTQSDQIKLGKMLHANNLIITEILEINQSDNIIEFSIKNLEIESGRILWKHEFKVEENNISESTNKAMLELEKKIN